MFRDSTVGQLARSGPRYNSVFAMARWRVRFAQRLAAALCAVGAFVFLAGCSTNSPNVGVAPVQSSTVSGLNPASAFVGGAGFVLQVTGSRFVDGSTVLWNNQGRPTTFINSFQLTAQITAADLATPGTISVGVLSPGATTSTTAGNNLSNFVPFTVGPANNAVPTITQLSPSSAVANTPTVTVTVTGTNFLSGSSVMWNGQSCVTGTAVCITTTFVSATQLTAVIPGGLTGFIPTTVPATQPQISVFNPAPGGGSSNSATFTITSVGAALRIAGSATSATASSTGRFVTFVAPSNSGSANGPAVDEIFVQDSCLGAAAGCVSHTILVSVPITGSDPDGNSRSPSVSADGRFVAFVSDASNLVAGDHNGVADVFLRDTCLGTSTSCTPTTTRLSVGPTGTEANGGSTWSSISAEGRYVAFDSTATDLVLDNLTGIAAGPYLRDTCYGAPAGCTAATTRINLSSTPTQ
jgi:hypothetical protein